MGGNAACWMDCLEVHREVPAMFPDFEHMFIDQYAPLDDKNIAQRQITRAAVAWHHTRIHHLI